MTKKNIIIAILGAVVLGAFLGLLIGLIGGFFTSSEEDLSASSESLTTVEEEQQRQQEEQDAAERAAADAAADSDTSDSDSDTTSDSTTTQSTTDSQSQSSSDNTADALGTGTVATGGAGLNLRASDSTDSNIIGSLSNGATLTIIGQSNGMYQVQTSDGQTGWVSSQYVTMN